MTFLPFEPLEFKGTQRKKQAKKVMNAEEEEESLFGLPSESFTMSSVSKEKADSPRSGA